METHASLIHRVEELEEKEATMSVMLLLKIEHVANVKAICDHKKDLQDTREIAMQKSIDIVDDHFDEVCSILSIAPLHSEQPVEEEK